MAADIQFDFHDESGRMQKRLLAAQQNFRDAHESYGERGRELDLAVRDQLANYYDPANRRAKLIQQAARELSEEIERYPETILTLGSRYIMSATAVDQKAIALGAQMMGTIIEAMSAPQANDDEGPLAAVHAAMERLTDAQKQNALLMAQGIVVGERLATATQVAADLLRLRQAELEGYLGQAPPAKALSIRQALIEAVAAEGRWTACEYLLTEVGMAIGTTIPIANIVVGIARIARDLQGKIRSLQARYERGDVDLMLDLAEEMDIEREALEDAVKLFAEVLSLSNTELELKPEFRTD